MSLLSHHCCTEGDSSADLSLISMQWWKPIARSASGDCGWVAIIVLEDSEQWRHLNAGSSRKLQPWGVSECASLLRKRGLSSHKTHEVSWWKSTSSLLCGYYQHLNEKGKIVIANSPVWGRVGGVQLWAVMQKSRVIFLVQWWTHSVTLCKRLELTSDLQSMGWKGFWWGPW